MSLDSADMLETSSLVVGIYLFGVLQLGNRVSDLLFGFTFDDSPDELPEVMCVFAEPLRIPANELGDDVAD